MGNCFSYITTRRGRKKVRIGMQERSPKVFASGPSSRTSIRRSAGSDATDECEAEAASGFFGFGSDTVSRPYTTADDSAAAIKPPQKFGLLVAQEVKRERQKSGPMYPQGVSPGRPPAMPTTKVYLDHRNSPGPSSGRSPAIPMTKGYGDYGLRDSPGPGSSDRSAAIPTTKLYGDNGHVKNPPRGPRPVVQSPADHGTHVKNLPAGGRKTVENKGVPSVADSLNMKGRRELEQLGLSNKGKSRIDSFNRSSGSDKSSGLHPRQPLPVDFDFLAQKVTKDNNSKGVKLQTPPAWKPRSDEEPTARIIDEDDPADHSEVRTSVSVHDIDEFKKTYRESAAKAAARDRDSFKSMSTSDSNDNLSSVSTVGLSSPGTVMPRRNSEMRTAPRLSEIEQEIVPVPMTFGALVKLDRAESQPRPSSSSMPGLVSVSRNRSIPATRLGTRAAEPRGGPQRGPFFKSRNT